MKYNAGFFSEIKIFAPNSIFLPKIATNRPYKKIVKTIRLNFLSLGFVLNFKVLAYG